MNETDAGTHVVLECAHCTGGGQCKCIGCRIKVWERIGDNIDLKQFLHEVKGRVVCGACGGSGKIVFWRE